MPAMLFLPFGAAFDSWLFGRTPCVVATNAAVGAASAGCVAPMIIPSVKPSAIAATRMIGRRRRWQLSVFGRLYTPRDATTWGSCKSSTRVRICSRCERVSVEQGRLRRATTG
jgi:hypothetical protein